MGSIPGWGAKIPHATWPKIQIIKQKQYCDTFNKDFKGCQKIFKKRKANQISLDCLKHPFISVLSGICAQDQHPAFLIFTRRLPQTSPGIVYSTAHGHQTIQDISQLPPSPTPLLSFSSTSLPVYLQLLRCTATDLKVLTYTPFPVGNILQPIC